MTSTPQTPGNAPQQAPGGDHHIDLDAGPIDGDALIHWVHTTLMPLIERPLRGGITWCPRWWEHTEAVWRFEAVRRAWTKAVTSDDPQSISDWALYCVDAHLGQLLSPTGPFADCGYSDRHGYPRHHRPQALPLQDPEDLDRIRFPVSVPHANDAESSLEETASTPSNEGGPDERMAHLNPSTRRNGELTQAQRGPQRRK